MYLERYYDPDIDLPRVRSQDDMDRFEIERIMHDLAMSLIAGSIPRRLGGDASDAMLAADKKTSRRVAWALRQSLLGWTGPKIPPVQMSDEVRRDGIQIVWSVWGPEHQVLIDSRLRLVSTWAIRRGHERWGRSAVVRLTNEQKWVDYALRLDLDESYPRSAVAL